jgi:acyl-CoA thioesterase FadM
MYPVLRFAKMAAGAIAGKKATVLGTDVIRLTVTRGDVEASRMNNGRYLTLMDLGRISLTLRAGYLALLAKRRWFPLVSSVLIQFQRSLRVGSSFDLSTRIVCWDDRYFYIEQWFERNDKRYAHAFVKAMWRSPQGGVGTHEILAAGGQPTESPSFPPQILAWQSAESAAFSR